MTAHRLCKHVREVDRVAIEELGMPGLVLMENAGRGAAERIRSLVPNRVLIACGAGNNGGDGFVIARHLDLYGIEVHVLLCMSSPDRLKGDAEHNYRWLQETSASILDASGDWYRNWQSTTDAPLIVDAILGTGAKGPPRSPLDSIIDTLNSLPATHRIAVDIPSGLDGDSGAAAPSTFRADETLTFVASKTGLLNEDAVPYVGEVRTIGIGVPRKVLERLKMPVVPT